MEDDNLKLLKEELTTQLDSHGFNKASLDILNHISSKENEQKLVSDEKLGNILSAKNEWEFCVDALENQAIVILDENLKVIRANRTIETWGWADITKVKGIHILNLITPAIQHASSSEWIDEWCQLDTQSSAEWVSQNIKTKKTYRFSYFPNKDIDRLHDNDNCYAVMLIADITNQNNLSEDKPNIQNDNDDTDLIRLSAYRLHQLANKLIQSQEQERKRVSSELHDGLGQILSALKYKVEFATIEAKEKPIDAEVVLKDILKNITVALTELRRVSSDLKPSVLEDLGVILALKWFTEEYAKIYTTINIDVKIDASESEIKEDHKVVIYRIVQEAINNIIKHAEAKNIIITLTKSDKGLLLRISDDGVGFNVQKMKKDKSRGLGLDSMEERALKVDGVFKMSSSKFSGTVVQVFWENY